MIKRFLNFGYHNFSDATYLFLECVPVGLFESLFWVCNPESNLGSCHCQGRPCFPCHAILNCHRLPSGLVEYIKAISCLSISYNHIEGMDLRLALVIVSTSLHTSS